MLVVSYPSPNWVNMNICTSCASLGNKNKMYIVAVKRPSQYFLGRQSISYSAMCAKY